MKKLLAILLCVTFVLPLGLFGCNRHDNGSEEVEKPWDASTIWVGNTAATSGAFAAVGVPFNIALEAYLDYYNAELKLAGQRDVKLKHYDDGFTADKGLEYTQKLVEDDKVFALVGHFGTPTIGATMDYIKEQKVPMVYAATGSDVLFNAHATGAERYIMPVQPIFTTEGAIMLCRAVAAANDFSAYPASYKAGNGLGLKKVGVIYTNDDAGMGMKSQIEKQLVEIKKVSGFGDVTVDFEQIAFDATDATAAATSLKNKGVQCVIMAANQAPSTVIGKAMVAAQLDVPALASYVNATATFAEGLRTANFFTANRILYTNAWVDSINQLADVAEFGAIMKKYAKVSGTGFTLGETWDANSLTDLRNNAYAMAGYIASHVFIQGLQRTLAAGDGVLTRSGYVNAMEAMPVDIPMSAGDIDYGYGKRLGLSNLSFFAYHEVSEAVAVDLTTFKTFIGLDELMTNLAAQVTVPLS